MLEPLFILFQYVLISSLKNIGIKPTHITFKLITNGMSLMYRCSYVCECRSKIRNGQMFLLNRLVNVYFNQYDSSIIDKILAYFFNSYWYNFASYILNINHNVYKEY